MSTAITQNLNVKAAHHNIDSDSSMSKSDQNAANKAIDILAKHSVDKDGKVTGLSKSEAKDLEKGIKAYEKDHPDAKKGVQGFEQDVGLTRAATNSDFKPAAGLLKG